jgi:hypothetical protein
VERRSDAPYEQGRGCDVYKLDLTTLAEQRYTKVNASDGSEYWPIAYGQQRDVRHA